jgi:heme oxygenase
MTDLEQSRHERYLQVPFANQRDDGDFSHRLICPMGFVRAPLELSGEPADPPLSELLRERTKRLHAIAERSGIIADILQRKADRGGYALLLRNLLPAYERLEAELSARRAHPVLGVFARRALRRSDRLRSDLLTIAGADWERTLPLLASGSDYASCVARSAAGDGLGLVSHAYVRYLGDLSGGQVLKKLLGKSMSLPVEALTVYDFPNIDTQILKRELREALDRAGRMTDDPHKLVIEAMNAFEHNIAISGNVRDRMAAEVSALL